MRIGIDATPLSSPIAGIGRYVAELCLRLDAALPEAQFFLYAPNAVDLPLPSSRWRVRVVRCRVPISYLWLKTSLRGPCERDRIDVFWATRTLLPRLAPGPRTISTVHDLNHLIVPDSMPRITRLAHRLWFRRDVARADRVIAVSQGTARRLREHMGVAAHGIAPPGVGDAFVPPPPRVVDECLARLGVSRPFFLGVGTLEPRKNLGALIQAFSALRKRGELEGHSLILVGKAGWSDRALRRLLEATAPGSVKWVGRVEDRELVVLYAACAAFVFPSLYEGFGIPAAEALACRARVIASDLPELREATRGCAHFIAPDRESIGEALLAAAQGRVDWPAPLSPLAWDDAARTIADAMRQISRQIPPRRNDRG